ncbi:MULTISPECIES: lysophospholipid acyltransferase family protein [unclassified Acidovorax]|jgi:KDO2-lipid IV(A) lauroyltransferase|uniref:lysophospholipid acyltransferase family protein n=1 Tax=unclassified Acidovorax TaxID=2684926 RepID=UPI000BD7D292|nr:MULTISPECIES: lysophospholipid acyltransferase family protein [unclassified Acidovorax]HQS22504.1 lysophospholipid acyltransferase family protein [Acidovorax defluvii]MBP7959539.1 lysophospholipid acyltransferase family protein [Acidovorax sp.]MBP8831060.1 lysophospholipid acyltransferase family protein [Acidovorax sp.]MBP9639943.1 lysophospholipid acyltransferase family protein [Acidovorax sp.]OYY26977.1 MAG: lipid A biosynthesis acyltransferase [Acidovorax sp. 35-64-16]
MPLVFRIFSIFPLWLLHVMGAAMGWVAFCASPTYRRRFLENSARAGYSFGAVRAAVAHAGRMVAELPRLWLGAPLPCGMVGEACVEQAYAAGRGIVFLTPHQGCFELSAQAAARHWSAERGPITVLYRPARQPWLARVMETARNRPGMLAVPTTLSGVRQMIKALRRGEAVGLLPDQVPPDGQGVWSPFFGRDAYTMTLAVRLAQQTGAAVVLARCERLPWGRGFVTHFEPLPAPLDERLESAVLQINQAMEHLIRQCPEQYLWGYARYKQPRAEATPGGAA